MTVDFPEYAGMVGQDSILSKKLQFPLQMAARPSPFPLMPVLGARTSLQAAEMGREPSLRERKSRDFSIAGVWAFFLPSKSLLHACEIRNVTSIDFIFSLIDRKKGRD